MMKQHCSKLSLITVCLLQALLGFVENTNAQTYSNSWIDFNNSYYKIKIAKTGIYRITKTQLDAIGFGNVAGSNFALLRDGKEVPIYVSNTSTLGSSDYIEFYGEKANGTVEAQMYIDTSYQPNEEVNLINDTAAYFLTYDNTTHTRYTSISNTIPTPTPSAAAYCWSKGYTQLDNRAAWVDGPNRAGTGYYYYSSDFDLSEGYSLTTVATSVSFTIATPNLYSSGPQSGFAFTWFGAASDDNTPHPYFTLNGNAVFDTSVANFKMVKRTVNVATSNLQASNTIAVTNINRFYVQRAYIRYPRDYQFSGEAAFDVDAANRYIEITGLGSTGQIVRLYDITNSKMYTATESGGTAKFYLDAATQTRQMYLAPNADIATAPTPQSVQFRNYATTANQGDYIILTHKDYINASPSYVNDFKTYRASATGGGHTVVVVDVTELYDQFGYGYDYNALGIRNFVAYALGNWSVTPEYMFIIGKGFTYENYRSYQQSPASYTYAPVPTWGQPGADNLLSAFNNDQKPKLATGRLSAYNNAEIGAYLEKVKAYDEAILPLTVPTSASELWKKKGLFIAGSSDLTEQTGLVSSLVACQGIFEDTLVGGMTTLIKKTTTDQVADVNNVTIDSMMNMGLGYISFYGHGSSQGFDFNLNSPDNYNSNPRFPVFSAFACEVANMFLLTMDKSISENYIASANGGAIAMIAANNLGWTGTLPSYMQHLYRSFAWRDYGNTLGVQYKNNISYLQDYVNPGDIYMDIHTQSLLLQGDPGLHLYNPDKRDYAIEANSISSIPANVTTALDSFTLRLPVYDLGKATRDSVWVKLQRFRPGATTVTSADSVLLTDLFNIDTIQFKMPIDPNLDLGVNNFSLKIDSRDAYDEISEANNGISYQLFIYSDNLVPVYPKEYAIVHEQGITLKASTLNAFAAYRNYKLEIDTTEYFNSSLKQSTTIGSIGGVLKWKPSLTYQDSTVYYWRAAPDSLINGTYSWSGSSFIYLANGSEGWNQSHFFQFTKENPFDALQISESTGRKFQFAPRNNYLSVPNAVVRYSLLNYLQTKAALNDVPVPNFECIHSGAIYIGIIDSASGKLWQCTSGLYGSYPLCTSDEKYMFEYDLGSQSARNSAMDLLQSVPVGNYIFVQNKIEDGFPNVGWNGVTAAEMQADTAVNGSGVSLYHTLKNLGFSQIDEFDAEKVFSFFVKKGNTSSVQQAITTGIYDQISIDVYFDTYVDTGTMTSTLVGPAKEWQSFHWKYSSQGSTTVDEYDAPYVKIFGVDTASQSTLLYSGTAKDTSLSFVSAALYPNLKLEWLSIDTQTRTSPQLDYWRVLYTPVPEAALNAAAYFSSNDSLADGETGKLRLAIENLTPYDMDSMLVSYSVIDANNVKHTFYTKRYKPLPGNDTIVADLDFDMSAYPGKTFLVVEANPDDDQPEQYHPNNIGYLSLYTASDDENPVLDVTFDGVHILDKDIVSAKPYIKIMMNDENEYRLLSDTSLMTVQLLYPDATTAETIPFDGTICRFVAAEVQDGKNTNSAYIEYKPTLAQDGVYKLIVTGKDVVGNIAGNAAEYEVQFTVENTPSITNVLNYPNPFSTATQFLFTMTGSEIPSQFKIQILTVTGKVVREIKKNELGDLHIGRNITDYRWDGKDEYGQMLGNGVYLYRVVTSIRGEDIEHRANASVDKYFKNGYGKLYIMR
ncbi:MAG: C25 family cysteine peptidase [Edaphocola sp.]